MIKPIVRDAIFLAQRSAPATFADLPEAHNLIDTLIAHVDGCVGMAANMIGVKKRIIAFFDGGKCTVMLNPEIVSRADKYTAEEGCLSLDGVRTATRFRSITVRYSDISMRSRTTAYSGFTAQIIQHEIDHCNGVLI